MGLLLLLLGVFFGLVLWCTVPRLLRMLGAAARRVPASTAGHGIRMRIAGD